MFFFPSKTIFSHFVTLHKKKKKKKKIAFKTMLCSQWRKSACHFLPQVILDVQYLQESVGKLIDPALDLLQHGVQLLHRHCHENLLGVANFHAAVRDDRDIKAGR